MSSVTAATHSYPVYRVHEREQGREIVTCRDFLAADPWFRSKKTRLLPAEHEMTFRLYTERENLKLELNFDILPDIGEDHGVIAIYFDPGHTRRKRHNAFALYIRPDGKLEYEVYEYEVRKEEVPASVGYRYDENGKYGEAVITVPLSMLKVETLEQRSIGFNIVRTYKDRGEEPVFVTWSGITGDRPQAGHGTGDLLLTRGLADAEVDEWVERFAADSDLYFMKWTKWQIPGELYDFVTEKKKGFTVRMNEEDVRKARENAERTEWGGMLKREILKVADYWAGKSDDELFELVPVGNPRALSVGQFFGDPYTGGKRTAYEVCLERPYQYYNPVSKTWYYNGMTLKNPTTGEELILDDDGRGFVAPEGFPNAGARYMYTASYRLFLLAMLMGNPYSVALEDRSVCPETSGKEYAGAIPNLAYAYHLTGNRKYALKALILIGRIAELIPYMNGNYGSGYYDTVQVSEPTTTETHWHSNFFEAADLLFDAMGELETELAEFFARKPDAENGVRQAPFSVKQAIQEMIPYLLYSAEIEKTRSADWSMRWIYAELIIASYMGSGKLMRHILYEGKYSLQSKIRNNFFRDGRYTYDSVFYVEHNCGQLAMLPNNTYRFRDDTFFPNGIDLFQDPQLGLGQVIKLYSKLRSGNLIAMFGDNSFANNVEPISEDRRKGKFAYDPAFEIIYRRLPSIREAIGPVLAQYGREELDAYRMNALKNSQLKHSLLLLSTAADWEEYRQLSSGSSPIQPSFLLQDSETSILRVGSDPHNCKHVMLYGQPTAGHGHGDKLGLWIGAYGYHLLAGAGNYPFTWISEKLPAWESHSAACTVVVVDGRDQGLSYSRQKCHVEGELLQVAGMENMTAIPGTHMERWCGVVKAPNGHDAYIFDLNYVQGGETFDYNTLGLDIGFDRVLFEGIEEQGWEKMTGTLAGPDVPLYSKPGQGWMKAERKAPVNGPVAWTFAYKEAGLKFHAMPEAGNGAASDPAQSSVKDGRSGRELICCLGERGGQEMRKSPWEPFVLWRDASRDGKTHAASFVSVLEPYERKPFLAGVRPLRRLAAAADISMAGESRQYEGPFQPAGIELRYTGEGMEAYKDILMTTYANELVQFADEAGREYATDAKMVLLRYRDDTLVEVEAIGYTFIKAGDYEQRRSHTQYKGRLVSADWQPSRIEAELEAVDDAFADAIKGQAALIDSPEYAKPSTYYMLQPQLEGNRFVFESDMTLIKLETDWTEPHKKRGLGQKQIVTDGGREVFVDIKAGDEIRIWNTFRQTLESR